MPAFVLEIGTEELPARFLPGAEKELLQRFTDSLHEAGLKFTPFEVYSTPRRLVVFSADIALTAETHEEVIVGPSVKAAFDMGGRPTRAAEGFAKTHGVTLAETFQVDTDKGTYIAVRKTLGGGEAMTILSQVCPTIISSLSFPKKMRWGSGDFTFARPLRWILALLGDTVVPFTVANISAGCSTYGHRVHGFGPFELKAASDYFSTMERLCGVTVKNTDRLATIRREGDRLALEKKGTVLWKDSLLQEVQGLCEHPVPILGSFDQSFLEVPREVLLTSMESHQKSFGIESENNRLLPYFLTVLNIEPQNVALVQKGWERVLRARLEDARFFWKTDLATSFDTWLASLDSVIFLAPLGSMGNKTRRLANLCAWLVDNVHNLGETISKDDAMRAGRLSKADLVSEMVKEFDTLQGIMGGIYAEKAGESAVVAKAIAEQYLPAGPDTPVPSSVCGALLSIADKADTLVGCFGLQMIPTGAADPYALRRAVLGIARIIQEKGFRLDVSALFARAFEEYGTVDWKLPPTQALMRLAEFFTLRLKNYLIGNGAETLLAESCLLANATDVWAVSARLEALTAFSKESDYEEAVLTFKRAANIIRKQGQDDDKVLSGHYDHKLLVDPAEIALANELDRITPLFEEHWKKDEFTALFGLLRSLRPFVDAFFASVMVMCDDEALKNNRLNLLQALVNKLGRLADFSALQM